LGLPVRIFPQYSLKIYGKTNLIMGLSENNVTPLLLMVYHRFPLLIHDRKKTPQLGWFLLTISDSPMASSH